MTLITGSPVGNVDTQEEIYLTDAPTIYFQDYLQSPLFNPDADGFYWGMSGTVLYPAYEIGCPYDVSLSENVTLNEILCDNAGVKATTQQRNYMEFTFGIRSFFPLQVLRLLLKGGAVTETSPTQKMPLGSINNDQFWHVYAPKVYNTDYGDYVWIDLHKCQFVDAITLNMAYGTGWEMTGIKLRAFVDSTKPAAQSFGMFGRSDLSVIT